MARRTRYPGNDDQRRDREHGKDAEKHYEPPARARKMASHSSRTAPKPPGARATQCAADNTTGWASATAAASPTADISGRSGVSSTMQAQFKESILRRFVSVC